MMSWTSLEFLIATLLVFQFTWFACADAADTMGPENDAAVKFDSFVDDLRAAVGRDRAGVRLVPCWNDFRCVNQSALETGRGRSRSYALKLVAIGGDGRELCLSEAHPSWGFLHAFAVARELSLLVGEGRLWAEYAT